MADDRRTPAKNKRNSKEMISVPALSPAPLAHSWAIVIILLATLPWWVGATCKFIALDDGAYVTENAMVLRGLTGEGIAWAFSNTSVAFWMPVTWLSLMLDASLFGTGPVGFHVTNVVFHILNALLVYGVLAYATGARWRSLLVALLFAMHPLRVESVAWVTERKDVLFTFFGLLAIAAYVRYTRRDDAGRWKFYGLMLVAFACSLMSKTMLVTLPGVLLLMDVWPLNRVGKVSWKRLIAEKLPLVVMSGVITVFTVIVQQQTQTLVGRGQFPLALRLQNVVVSYMSYLRDQVYFSKLAVFYPLPRAISEEVWVPALALFVVISVGLVVAWRYWKPALPLVVGWVWFVLTLLPVIGLVQSGEQARADRFTYWPSIGLMAGMVFAVPTVRGGSGVVYAKLVGGACVVVLGVYMTLQLWLWRDPLTLYMAGLERAGESAMLNFAMGYELERVGNEDDALAYYLKAVQMAPNLAGLHNNLGQLMLRRGYVDEAILSLEVANRLAPGDEMYRQNLEAARARRHATRPGL